MHTDACRIEFAPEVFSIRALCGLSAAKVHNISGTPVFGVFVFFAAASKCLEFVYGSDLQVRKPLEIMVVGFKPL